MIYILSLVWDSDFLFHRLKCPDLPLVYGDGNGTPLQDSCLENPMDGGGVGCGPWGC